MQGSPEQGEEIRDKALLGGFPWWFWYVLVHFVFGPLLILCTDSGFLGPTESQLGARLGKINREEMRSFFRGFGHPKADVLDDHVVLQ